jgi:hypothetical protein
MSTYAASNHKQTIKTDVGEFLIEQRDAGFVDNDGQWIVTQLPELYWSSIGILHQRRPATFLGVFRDRAAVDEAISRAAPQPEHDQAVKSMGRASC